MMPWLERKRMNRRLGRGHVLDVKVRSQQARLGRMRLATATVSVVLGTAAVLFVLYQGGSWLLENAVLQNHAFALRTIDIQTDGSATVDEVRRRIDVRLGENLLALDLSRIKRDLELEAWIREASVERILPHTLRVRVTERDPLAKVHAFEPRRGGGYEPVIFLVDTEGYVMRPRGANARGGGLGGGLEQLPALEGLGLTELRPGQRLRTPLGHAALRLVLAFEESTMFGVQELGQINVRGPDVLRVTTRQGSQVVFPLAGFPQHLARWHAIHAAGLRMGKAIATLDLSVTNNLPAQWMEASAVPPRPAQPVKPARHRRRHV